MAGILVIVAHPDDEILGAGGTIRKLVNEGDEAYCLLLASGITGRFDGVEMNEAIKKQLGTLQQECRASSRIIGYKQTEFCNLPDNRLDELPLLDIVKIVEKKILELKPSILFTHHYGDLNIDHRIAFQAAMTASRPIGDYSVQEVWCFETLSSTEWDFTYNTSFKPNLFVDIENTFEDKANAMKCYASELREYPHPRSMEALEIAARRWGTVVGCRMAEPFELIRKVKR